MTAKYSKKDSVGRIFVDCAECDRGGNGSGEDPCSCGWKIKKGFQGGCFCGSLIDGLEAA